MRRFRPKTLKQFRDCAPEKVVQSHILAFLRGHGFFVWSIPNRGLYDARRNRYDRVDDGHVAGIPDLEVALPVGVTVRIEVKAADGKVSPAQKAVMERLGQLGHPTFVARCVDDVDTFFRQHGYIKS